MPLLTREAGAMAPTIRQQLRAELNPTAATSSFQDAPSLVLAGGLKEPELPPGHPRTAVGRSSRAPLAGYSPNTRAGVNRRHPLAEGCVRETK